MAADPSRKSLPAPSRAEYVKIQELSSGGMGSVDLARATSGPNAGQIVALKRLHPHLEREKHFADMFFDEAWITAGLHHPNVVQIYDWGIDSQGRYLAMEFIAGDSLLALIRDSKKANVTIPLDLALYIVGRTAEGLHAAHELRNEDGDLRHLVHRDVTPSNVLVSIHGDVKLIDFGVAKARDRLAHTTTGTIKGKFGYMSPEQARGQAIDRRSDVFALGVVLWETLAQKRLYRSESELEILRMIVEDPPPPIRSLRPDVPPAIEQLLAGALAKKRDDRLGSCAEFADFVWAVYNECGFTAGAPELAALFRQVMPERHRAIEQLLSGAENFLEPTVARPSSGSFSSKHDALNQSGAAPRPMPSADLPATSVSGLSPAMGAMGAPASRGSNPYLPVPGVVNTVVTPAPASRGRGAVLGGLALVAVLALVGGAWALGARSNAPVAANAAAPPVAAANLGAVGAQGAGAQAQARGESAVVAPQAGAQQQQQQQALGAARPVGVAGARPPVNANSVQRGGDSRQGGRDRRSGAQAQQGGAGITAEDARRAMLREPNANAGANANANTNRPAVAPQQAQNPAQQAPRPQAEPGPRAESRGAGESHAQPQPQPRPQPAPQRPSSVRLGGWEEQ